MQIQIVSKNIDVSPALTARINERFDEMMDKYIHREGEAHVSVSREGTGFRTVCSVHLPSFNNAKHGGMNVVFKRPDGNIGWIDPKA